MEPEVASRTTTEEAMTTHGEHQLVRDEAGAEPFYPPDLLPLLQALLADLADIDFAHEKNLEAIRHSPGDDRLKRAMTDRLRRHEARRASVARDLMALQRRIEAIFG